MKLIVCKVLLKIAKRISRTVDKLLKWNNHLAALTGKLLDDVKKTPKNKEG